MESSPPRRRAFEPEPVETSVRKVRRFPVEPVETSTRSSKKEAQNHPAPSLDASSAERSPPKRRFVPEPIETTFKSSRLPSNSHTNALPTPDPTPIQRTPPLAEEAKPPRPRFKPQLIETSRRSKRAGDTRPATLPTDKTDITPGTNHIYVERRKYRPPPSADATDESLASAAARLRTHAGSRPSTRQNSFQPELEVIESDEHESSSVDDEDLVESVPSLSGSYESSDESVIRQQLARTRESCDDRFSGYLLELAAKAAEKQLQEQALAAFPNETFHEIVEHFYDREVESSPSDDGSMEAVGLLPHEASIKIQPLRRQSSAEWATLEMQRHQDSLHRLREEERLATEKADTGVQPTLWNNVGAQISPFARIPEPPLDKQKEQEDKRMLKAASPPMLGSDIQFRMCPSPKATKFESDQRVDLHLNRSETGGGLWGGFCVAEEVGEYILPSVLKSPDMLQTPDREREDPFASAWQPELRAPPPARIHRPRDLARASTWLVASTNVWRRKCGGRRRRQPCWRSSMMALSRKYTTTFP